MSAVNTLDARLSPEIAARTWQVMPDTFAVRISERAWMPAKHHALMSYLLYLVRIGFIKRLIVNQPPGSGKALALDTPIPTPTGWTTIGEIQPGDQVFGADGRPCTVTAVSPVWDDRPCYDVVTSDGDTIVADEAHEWWANLCRQQPFRIYDTKALSRPRGKRAMVHVAPPLDLPDADLPVDPYVLGLWLGDGTSKAAIITAHDDDAPFLRSQIETAGYRTSDQATHFTFGILGLHVKLRALDVLGNKHVPAAYLRASRAQRLALLQGLIDSDGYVSPRGHIEFCTTSPRLATAVTELVRTLGVKTTCRESRATLYGKDCGPRWRISFFMADAARLPRKADRCRNGTRTPNRYVTATPTAPRATRCIQVDSADHLFLAGRSMTPTHNSEMVSRWFPAWAIEQDPSTRIILASYEALLAEEWGKQVRAVFQEHTEELTTRLRQDSQASNRWRTTGMGGMWTTGTGGSITGRRARYFVIDDPHKNFAEAHSETNREAVWNWYTSTARTRLLPGGSIINCQTRWHEGGLPGRMLERSANGGVPWTVVRLPAIAVEDETIETVIGRDLVKRLRDAGFPVPMWDRKAGEALWPELTMPDGSVVPWFDLDELSEIEAEVGPYVWNGLYQQNPTSPTGSYFPVDKWRMADELPNRCRFVRRWDLAATEGAGDWTVGTLVAYDDAEKHTYIVDVVRDRLASSAVRDLVRMTAELDRANYGRKVEHVVEQEPGSSGKSVAEDYVSDVLAGFAARYEPTTGDKELNALPLASQQQVGNVSLLKTQTPDGPIAAHWWAEFIEEARAFPGGTHDDQVDTAGHAYNDLMLSRKKKSRAQIRRPGESTPPALPTNRYIPGRVRPS